MKKNALLAFAASLLLVANAPANLLDFGAFDSFGNGTFEGWQIGPKPDDFGISPTGTISQSTDGFQNDGQSASFAFKGSGDFRLSHVKRLEINPGQKYRISVTTKSGGGPVTILGSIIMIPGLDADGKRGPVRTIPFTAECKGEWQTSVCEVTAGPAEMKLGVSLTLRNGSSAPETLLVDAVTVEEAP